MNQIFHHWSRVATDSISWDYTVCTRDTLWRQHYVRTSKKYLINCHILFAIFWISIFRLQLLQILCKLIINWVNCEKKQKGSFYETPCIKAYLIPSPNAAFTNDDATIYVNNKRFRLPGANCHRNRSTRLQKIFQIRRLEPCVVAWSWQ